MAEISANPVMWSAFEDSFSGTQTVDRSGPGVHALVIGVSSYPKLGSNPFKLAQLTSAATSAAEFANWLLKAYPSGSEQPLRSVRLLLSPSPSEEIRLRELQASGALPARQDTVSDALTEWSRDCNSVAGNFAILYAAGHGMAAALDGPNLLLENFWENETLAASLYIPNIQGALGSYPNIDKSALFIDCCQQVARPDLELGTGLILPRNRSRPESRRAYPVYYAAPRGKSALGVPGGLTYFADALLKCLKGQAAVRKEVGDGWCVTSYSLGKALPLVISSQQTVSPQLTGLDLEICSISEVPSSPLAVSVKPSGSYVGMAGEVTDEDDDPVHTFKMERNPYSVPMPCGTYTVFLRSESGKVRPRRRNVFLIPPRGGSATFEAIR